MKKIMIIDDNELDHYIARYMIAELDDSITVVSVFGAEDALDMLSEQAAPDLILLDINMPTINGYEFLNIYGQSDMYDETPIIMCSSSVIDRNKALSSVYVNDYIIKSMSPDDLQKINHVLNVSKTHVRPAALPLGDRSRV